MELEKLRAIIGDVLNIEPNDISLNASFIDDLGADSLDIFQIMMGIEEEFGVDIPTDTVESISTVGDALEQIKAALN